MNGENGSGVLPAMPLSQTPPHPVIASFIHCSSSAAVC
jgi:hypothetical protein